MCVYHSVSKGTHSLSYPTQPQPPDLASLALQGHHPPAPEPEVCPGRPRGSHRHSQVPHSAALEQHSVHCIYITTRCMLPCGTMAEHVCCSAVFATFSPHVIPCKAGCLPVEATDHPLPHHRGGLLTRQRAGSRPHAQPCLQLSHLISLLVRLAISLSEPLSARYLCQRGCFLARQ